MNAGLRSALAAAALLGAGPAIGAEDKDAGTTVGVSVEASTLGAGLSIGMPVGERFNVRGVYHGFTFDKEFEDDKGGTYDGEIDLQSTGLMVDFHPFKGTFRLTAGFASNGNQINFNGTGDSNGRFQVGDCTYQSDPGDPLVVDGVADFNSSAPYVGIGWGGILNVVSGFFMTFDLGILMSGAPTTSLAADGTVTNTDPTEPGCGIGPIDASDPEFQQALRDAEDEVDRETKDYKYWPNIALGIGWRF